jgi:hypothetical protein
MKHLVLTVGSGIVSYQLRTQTRVSSGSHPMGDDTAQQVIDYLISIIKPTTHEVI